MNVDVGRIPFPALNDVTDRAMSNCFCRLMQPWFGEIISVFSAQRSTWEWKLFGEVAFDRTSILHS